MTRNPEARVDTLRSELEAGDCGSSDADRELLLEALANMELVPSEVGTEIVGGVTTRRL